MSNQAVSELDTSFLLGNFHSTAKYYSSWWGTKVINGPNPAVGPINDNNNLPGGV